MVSAYDQLFKSLGYEVKETENWGQNITWKEKKLTIPGGVKLRLTSKKDGSRFLASVTPTNLESQLVLFEETEHEEPILGGLLSSVSHSRSFLIDPLNLACLQDKKISAREALPAALLPNVFKDNRFELGVSAVYPPTGDFKISTSISGRYGFSSTTGRFAAVLAKKLYGENHPVTVAAQAAIDNDQWLTPLGEEHLLTPRPLPKK